MSRCMIKNRTIIKTNLWANADCKTCEGQGVVIKTLKYNKMKFTFHPKLCECVRYFKTTAYGDDTWQIWCDQM